MVRLTTATCLSRKQLGPWTLHVQKGKETYLCSGSPPKLLSSCVLSHQRWHCHGSSLSSLPQHWAQPHFSPVGCLPKALASLECRCHGVKHQTHCSRTEDQTWCLEKLCPIIAVWCLCLQIHFLTLCRQIGKEQVYGQYLLSYSCVSSFRKKIGNI